MPGGPAAGKAEAPRRDFCRASAAGSRQKAGDEPPVSPSARGPVPAVRLRLDGEIPRRPPAGVSHVS